MPKTAAKTKDPEKPQELSPPRKMADPIEFTRAMMEVYDRAAPMIEEYLQKQDMDPGDYNWDPLNIAGAYTSYLERLSEDPAFFWDQQAQFWQRWFHLWQESTLKFLGDEEADTLIEPDKSDRRFRDPEWQEGAVFDFLKQSYLLTAEWMEKSVRETPGLEDDKKEKLAFATRLFTSAISPSNFAMTNPEVIRETLDTGGENLLKGLENLIEDLERGQGELKISTTDYDAFEVGKNLAVTPGQVVFQNDLMQLIQYKPQTEKVFKRPLLIIPPWINKYYILDMRPENSFINWAVQQGHTVFIISWVNPDEKLAQKSFESYMNEGVLTALDQIENITGEKDFNVIGYCLGGTLLAITLSYLRQHKKQDRIASATFFTTLIDFEDSGELKLFTDEAQLQIMEKSMQDKGYLEARKMQQTFSILRANDLIWSFVVNNYLLGKEPFPFDLLYWNDDSTNLPAAMHTFYLRKMYQENQLVKPGGIQMDDTPIDVRKIKTPSYFLSTKEDHIAPWQATFAGSKLLGGDVTFTLAASGHIAGVVNPPAKNKYCYWTSDVDLEQAEDWLDSAKQKDGSWWPHWQKWMKNYTGDKVPARKIKDGIEPAPGRYVKVKRV